MSSGKVESFTRGFFWFGFCVFLGASIPHIAAYYRHFDPSTTGLEDIANWTIGYLIAVVIDVTDVLVSITVMKEMSKGRKWYELIGYWLFIIFVMALSWLINWQYNIVFATDVFAKADSQRLFTISIGQLNPIIGSAFQLLLLVYTSMAHKLTAKSVIKTAQELEKEADELEKINKQKHRINQLKAADKNQAIGNLFGTIGTTIDQSKGILKKVQKEEKIESKPETNLENVEAESEDEFEVNDDPIVEEIEPELEDEFEVNQSSISESIGDEKDYLSDVNNDPIIEEFPVQSEAEFELNQPSISAPIKHERESYSERNSDEITVLNKDIIEASKYYPKIDLIGSTSGPTASVTEVSLATGLTEVLLRNRIRKGELKTANRNKELIVKKSLYPWLITYSFEEQKARKDKKTIDLKQAKNQRQNESNNSSVSDPIGDAFSPESTPIR